MFSQTHAPRTLELFVCFMFQHRGNLRVPDLGSGLKNFMGRVYGSKVELASQYHHQQALYLILMHFELLFEL